ncbi:methionyl-tRNA formyltransferase [Alkalihalobacillus pseudalcaliphilus]|uniref:methionyl-tRNA formyltransferase n=1 Tax=Alkalihalobacillus pseudalcaliphilus TaxID=79884 RepID=UPI00064DB9C3|nr:methionyl-tRNA formyltransferase [Alkalihalobacillus pseudalcaliphilus]KMK77352.1 methionyl-tRNA formyltransferase [Alkalihalobacillus pseudalcaliphilus]
MKIVFMGTPDFSVPVLKQLAEVYEVVAVVTQPDRPVGRKKVLTPPPVKVAATELNIPVLQPEKVRVKEELELIFEYEPDLIVTAAYGQILPKALLDFPRLGCVNVHASLLPKYRGGAPIHQSIIDGESETGVTIMYMVEKLDAGDILTQVRVPIEEEDHVGTVHDKLSQAGASLLMETIPQLVDGSLVAKRQNDQEATFARNISREMEELNWSRTGEELYNQIRGLHPWPVAYTSFRGKPIKVWWASKVTTNKQATPGEIIEMEEDGFIVATGNKTALKMEDIQPAGKKRMTADTFLRGTTIELGEKLGDKE